MVKNRLKKCVDGSRQRDDMFKFLNSLSSKHSPEFSIGQKIYSNTNGRVCLIKNERILNNIKHFTLSIENEYTKRNILLSEKVVKKEYRAID